MKIIKFAAILFLYFLLNLSSLSCSKKTTDLNNVTPTPNFSFTIQNEVPPAVVNFSNTSTDATSYYWDFGDNSSSTNISPSHTYAANGNYTVTLKATNSVGVTNQTQNIITIGAKTLVITAITIDSVFEFSTPISFFVGFTNPSTPLYSTSTYNLPASQNPIYPAGVWNNLNYSFNMQNKIGVVISYSVDPSRIPFYPMPNGTGSFTLNANDYTVGINQYPKKIVLVNNPGLNETKITLNVTWQ